MGQIQVLDQDTINQIAAGEVIERPASVVKELMENAIDAMATALTVEIKEGGISFIRITDNGAGMGKNEVETAFLRHATSKIKSAVDLLTITSLGFRGEALSSIAAVSMVELVTKRKEDFFGTRYEIAGGKDSEPEEIGVPDGTTFIVRNLFYNTPARKKFLKTPMTEAGYINDIVCRMAMSHPEVSIRFINNGKHLLHTSGNGSLKDVIYSVYGKEIAMNLLEVHAENDNMKISGFIGKPLISRGNRTYENYFINGRYIKSNLVSKAIEEGYRNFMMQHKYPFTAIIFRVNQELLDVNVHPTKMELRFRNSEEIYPLIINTITDALKEKELIPEAVVEAKEKKEVPPVLKRQIEKTPEIFETKRTMAIAEEKASYNISVSKPQLAAPPVPEVIKNQEQLTVFDDKLLSKAARESHKLIGQVFDTYWIVQYGEKMFIIDQHAAHEKVLYERAIERLKTRETMSQALNPPIILTLNMREEEVIKDYMDYFIQLGFEIESFGGNEYAVRAIPFDFFSIGKKELLLEIIDDLSDDSAIKRQSDLILEKIASMSCKAAVKGNNALSASEANSLIDELLSLENPYNCPHGRPTIISMSKYELEKKFKRIV